MAVTNQTPFKSFTAAPGATVFSSEFRVIQSSDLVVRIDGVVATSGYTVTGLGEAAGVDVTFTTPMTGGEMVELLRSVPLTRASDYQQLGDFQSPVVNQDFDRLWMSQQDQEFKIGGSLRLPFPEQVGELPAASSRAGRLLGFNSVGEPVAVVPESGSAADFALDLASPEAGKGPDLVAADVAEDYADGSLGFLVVKNTSNAYNALRGFPKAEQQAIQAGTSTDDHATELDDMLSTEKHLYLPRGAFRRSTKWSITNGHHLTAAGSDLTQIIVTADVEAMEFTGEFIKASGFTLTKTGVHTKNLMNIGTALGARCDRADFRDIIVTGAGLDGIVLYAGNLGTLANIRARLNARDGLRFDRPVSPDNNAWTFAGFIDSGFNGRDGVRFDDATSLSDAYASRTHNGGTLVAQSNGGWGVYVGTTRCNLTIYAEANTAGQVYLGQYAGGNRLAIMEGTVVGNVGGVAGSTDGNQVIQLNHGANFRAGYKSRIEVSGGPGKGIRIAGDDGTAGFLDFEKSAGREMRTKYSGSTGTWAHYHEHTTSGTEAAQFYGGRLLPMTVSTWDLGSGSLRWKDVYADSIRLGAGSRAILTGSGSPEGVVTASPGAIYLNTGGGAGVTLYVKETGSSTNTGWVAK